LYSLVRIAEYKNALDQSQYPPYWASNLYGGLGSPDFVYYAPLYSFVSSSLISLAGGIDSAAALTLMLTSVAGLIFMFLFLRELLGRYEINDDGAIRVGLYFYGLSPYLIADKLIRSASAEFMALSIAPLVFYGIVLIQRKPRAGSIILSVGIALTILSHNLTALIVFALSLFVVVLMYYNDKIKLAYSSASMMLGLCMSAFFWLPALYYKSLVRAELLTIDKFDFHNQFKGFVQYFWVEKFYSAGPFPIILLMMAGAVYIYQARNKNNHILFPTIILLAALSVLFILLQLSVSIPLWEIIPFMELFQFPWRMMGPLALVTAVLAAILFACITTSLFNRKKRLAEFIILIACLLVAVPQLNKVRTFTTHADMALPEFLSAESIRHQAMPATVGDEYLPKYADPSLLSKAISNNRPLDFSISTDFVTPMKSEKSIVDKGEYTDADRLEKIIQEDNPVFSYSDGMSISGTSSDDKSIIIHLFSKSSGIIHLARWYYPVWHAHLNGLPLNVFPDERGLLSAHVPAGRHKLEITKAPPTLRQYTLIISAISLAIWLLMMIITILVRRTD